MIQLKRLLLEQSDVNKPKILFVGDKQTLAKDSYASNLINSGKISGVIAGKYKATAGDLYKSLRDKLDNSYNATVIMLGPDQVVDTNTKTIVNSTRVLQACIRLAKSVGQKVIVISAPLTKAKSNLPIELSREITNKIESNTSADDIISIDVSSSEFNKKTGVLNSSVQQEIQDAVVESINELLQIDISSPTVSSDEEDIEAADDVVTALATIPTSAANFIQQWKDTALAHMKKYGIPASVTLAQAALESGWGRSGLTTKYNNYFGITGSYRGNNVKLKNADGDLFTWRVYPTPEDSFNDHADLLDRKYRPTVENPTYEDWTKTLTDRGYAGSAYGSKLNTLIKKYSLDKFDRGEEWSATNNVSADSIAAAAVSFRSSDAGPYGKYGGFYITSPFKPSHRPNHSGIDYRAKSGTPLTILKPGTVVRAGNWDTNGWGNCIEIKHEDGSMTRYAHLSKIGVKKGDVVEAGQLIGLTGGNANDPGPGNSKAAHLHWEWLPDGVSRRDGKDVASTYFSLG